MDTSSTMTSTTSNNNNNVEDKLMGVENMQIETTPKTGASNSLDQPPRVPSPMITVSEEGATAGASGGQKVQEGTKSPRHLTPTQQRKISPAAGVSPRQRKRSQPVRGDLLPDPDKLLSYKHHERKEEEALEDPKFPGGQPKQPPEPRQAGEPAERKRSTVTFCPVIQTIEK